MKQIIKVEDIKADRVRLTMQIGKAKATVINLKRQMLPGFIRNSVISRLNHYVNHRAQLLCNHGAYVTVRKMEALDRLKQKLAMSNKWTTLATAKHIKAMREDLVTVMPGQSSRYYNSSRELLADLIYWADMVLTQHRQHYAASPEH